MPSQVKKFQEILGSDFFNDFEGNLSTPVAPEINPHVKEDGPVYQSTGSGYKVTIEIDPLHFDPKRLDSLSTNLRNALESFQREMEEVENRTKIGRQTDQ